MQKSTTASFVPEPRARQTVARHESLVLSERDRAVFFDTLMHPPTPNARLLRAVREAEERIAG